jgi:hypothetical protein
MRVVGVVVGRGMVVEFKSAESFKAVAEVG